MKRQKYFLEQSSWRSFSGHLQRKYQEESIETNQFNLLNSQALLNDLDPGLKYSPKNPTTNLSFAIGEHTSEFQAEIYAVLQCARINMEYYRQ